MHSVPAVLRRALAALTVPALLAAQGNASPFDALRFRNIGPAVTGGRMHDVEGVPNDPSTIWIAAASGGIWKSTSGGISWTPVFDNQSTSVMGDLAIFGPDPNIVWAGTGEQNNRQSSSYGDGVFRTTDGGKTWRHLGLQNTRSIGRVRLHPSNPDIAYVAASGNLWKASPDRGVYKTVDGGKTWTKSLFVDTLTGAVDLVMDPVDPGTLYAAMYQHLRTPWGYNGGGPGSGIYKTTDGGATWKKLTKGIPLGDIGRIGLAIAQTYPRLLLATIEHPTEGGTYRSEDGGETWAHVNATNPRPMYYSHIYIDPTNERRAYILGVTVYRSDDGGKSFRELPNSAAYDLGLKTDNHAIWINPNDPKTIYLAGDGGLHVTYDMGANWRRINNIPVGQFYAIGADNRDPYWIYGGMQDNHSWMGPSATRHWLGIVNTDWRQIGFSDGTYEVPDPFVPRWVYSSSTNLGLYRVDVETGDRLAIRPTPPPGDSVAYRFDWVAPVLASRHTKGLVYAGGNRLFISRDHGMTWSATKDLSKQVNRDTLRIMGVLGTDIRISRHDGENGYGELVTISESPLDVQVIWAGVDDGNVQVSQDGGKTWTEVSGGIPGVPPLTAVSRVVASSAGRGAAYVTFDGHRSGDFEPYAFRTTDYGRTWTKVLGGVPSGESVRTLHEYPGMPGTVFLGTERALYVSIDTARSWRKFAANLPTTRYDDILVHPRTKDLILGTHGRAIWILDDASPVASWTSAVAAKPAHLFPIRPATAILFWDDFSNWAQGEFAGDNPQDGALISYSLSRSVPSVSLTVTSADGRVVRKLVGPGQAGVVQRVAWDLRHAPMSATGFVMPQVTLPGGRGGRGGRGGGGGGGGRGGGGEEDAGGGGGMFVLPRTVGERGAMVAPGTFTVTLEAGDARATETVRVLADPLLTLTLAQLKEREAFQLSLMDLSAQIVTLSQQLAAVRRDVVARRDAAAAGSPARAEADRQLASLTIVERAFVVGPAAMRGQLGQLAGVFNGSGAQQGSLYPPSGQQKAQVAAIRSALDRVQRDAGLISK